MAGGVTGNRYYIGNLYEEKEKNDTITKINYIFADGKAIAIFETRASGESTLLFMHHDPLGSVNAYSDADGNIAQELSYDAWGRRRNPDTWAYYTDIIDAGAWDPHGFTGHEHIDLFEVVNMDGRMYDPVIGRFLSPDPIIQSPDFSQSLNRYAYCLNNPLSLVDPSGYSWFSKNWKSLTAAAVGITVAALTGNLYAGAKGLEAAIGAMVAGAAGGAAGAMTGALLNGCNLGQVAKATFTGAFWGGVSGFLNYAAGGGTFLEQMFRHSLTDAWVEGIQGGNALHGLISGALNTAGNAGIYGIQGLGDAGKIAASAVLGGTVAEIGGGKFANGAITAAYSMMFNDLMHKKENSYQDDDYIFIPKIYEEPLESFPIEFLVITAGKSFLNRSLKFGSFLFTRKSNSIVIENFIGNLPKSTRLKGGVRQVILKEKNINRVFQQLASKSHSKIRYRSGEAFFESGNYRVGLHESSRGGGRTIHINVNKGEKLYKIRSNYKE